MSQHVQDRWSPEPGPKDLACFLEVTGYPKTSLCGVSEMVAEGEGTGSSWLFLSKFPQNGMAKSLADTVTHRSPAASFRAPGARDLEAARLEPRRALSAIRAALAAAGGKAHASGEKPKAREPQRRRDLARVKRLSPEQSVRATSQPDAPPSLPLLPPLAPRPAAAEAAFQELSRNPPHVTAAPASALKRPRR